MREHKNIFKIMHWLVAVFILAAFVLAWTFDDMKFSPEKLALINYHKWVGFLVLILFLPRLISGIYGYSKLEVKTWQDKLAKTIHYFLYVTMFTTPLLGWLMSSAKGFSVKLFTVISIPDLIDKNKELGDTLSNLHELSANLLFLLLFLHISGAIYRQFIKKDKIISKMIK